MKPELEYYSKKYDENYTRLEASVGTPEHDKYVKIERQLERQITALQRKFGYMVDDPCPLRSCHFCSLCTGYYHDKKYSNRRIHKNYTYAMCHANDRGAIRCKLAKVI